MGGYTSDQLHSSKNTYITQNSIIVLPQNYPVSMVYNYFSFKAGRQRGRVVRASDLKSVGSRVQILFWPPADVVLESPEFNFLATLVNSQLVCLPQVGILNLVVFIWILIYHCMLWSWKDLIGSGQSSIHTCKLIFSSDRTVRSVLFPRATTKKKHHKMINIWLYKDVPS